MKQRLFKLSLFAVAGTLLGGAFGWFGRCAGGT